MGECVKLSACASSIGTFGLRIHSAPLVRYSFSRCHRSHVSSRHWQVRAGSSSSTKYVMTDREQHNRNQARLFDANAIQRLTDVPKVVIPRLKRIAEIVPGLNSESRVMDVGSGPGTLIPHFQERGVQEVLAIEVSPAMVNTVRQNFLSTAATEGNMPQVRTWLGDVQSLPAYQAPFHAAYLNAVFGNVFDQRDTLLCTALLLKPGGYIVLSHPLGREWLNKQLHEKDPEMVPHPLPDQHQLAALIADLPLRIVEYVDEDKLYMVLLQVPENYMLQRSPVQLHGDVTSGFGRGSKQLGFPTANLPPIPLEKELNGLPKGVYFGWARLLSEDFPEEDRKLHKMVMNIGQNPTVNEADAETTVEIHVLHKFSKDFYGRPMQAIASGFIRPEMKFNGIGALIARIKTDAGIAAKQLDEPAHQKVMQNPFLSG